MYWQQNDKHATHLQFFTLERETLLIVHSEFMHVILIQAPYPVRVHLRSDSRTDVVCRAT